MLWAWLSDGVCEEADAFDGDPDFVSALECKGVGRDDSCARKEKAAVGEALITEEVFDECRRIAFQFGQRGGARELCVISAKDVEFDPRGCGHGFVADEDAGAEGAASVVDFGLRKIERVGAFDVAGAHVVADGVADDLAARVDEKGEFGFRHRPRGVTTDFDEAVRACDFVGDSFEEELGAFGGVDAVVEISSACVFGFGDAGAAAAVVGDAGGPDLLIADGGKKRSVDKVIGRRCVGDFGFEMGLQIMMSNKSVQRGLFEWIGVVFVMDEECFPSSVEYQGFRPSRGMDVGNCVMDSDESLDRLPLSS
jgi:hypothetical protein